VPLLRSLPTWFFGLRLLFGHDTRRVTHTELIVVIQVDIVPSIRQRVQQELLEGKPGGQPEPPEPE